jgi:hypothetical protein
MQSQPPPPAGWEWPREGEVIEVEVVHPVEKGVKGVKGVQLEREALRLADAWPTPGRRLGRSLADARAGAWPTPGPEPGRRLGRSLADAWPAPGCCVGAAQ